MNGERGDLGDDEWVVVAGEIRGGCWSVSLGRSRCWVWGWARVVAVEVAVVVAVAEVLVLDLLDHLLSAWVPGRRLPECSCWRCSPSSCC